MSRIQQRFKVDCEGRMMVDQRAYFAMIFCKRIFIEIKNLSLNEFSITSGRLTLEFGNT